MEELFFVTLYEHRVLGFIFLPYSVIKQKDQDYFVIKERLTGDKIDKGNGFGPDALNIIKLCDEYSDSTLVKVFSKKKQSVTDFLNNIDDTLFNERIRPYIEKRLFGIFKVLIDSTIPLFHKTELNNIYHSDLILIPFQKAETVFHFKRHESGLLYHLSIRHEDKDISLTDKPGIIIANDPCLLVLDNLLFHFDDIDGKKLLPFFTKEHVQIPKQSENRYFKSFIKTSIEKYKVVNEGFKITEIKEEPAIRLSLEYNLYHAPAFRLQFQYPRYDKWLEYNATAKPIVVFDEDEVHFYKIYRKPEAEKQCFEALQKMGISEESNGFLTILDIKSNDAYERLFMFTEWINKHKTELSDQKVGVINKLDEQKIYLEAYELKIDIEDHKDWFDIKAYVQFKDFRIPFLRLRNHILKEIREYKLPNGEVFIIPEDWFTRYKEVFVLSEDNEEALKLKKQHFTLVEKFEGLDKKQLQKVKKLELVETNDEVPAEIKATLRPYQVEGFNWMHQLTKKGFGACLADDMGLGKTLQTITLLQASIKDATETNGKEASKPLKKQDAQLSLFQFEEEGNKGQDAGILPSLIVMPTSLIHNWDNELNKFAPHLRVIKYTGSDRMPFANAFGQADVILTTYGILRNDFEAIKPYTFHFIVLDESQLIKNPESKAYKAVIKLQSHKKAVLSGTPVENSLTDIWTQLNFLNKGLLGSYHYFKSEFVQPIENKKDEAQSNKLKALIQPFILRRTKQEVAPELPNLTEHNIVCDMPHLHKKYYETEKSKIRNAIIDNIQKEGIEKSSIIILQGLTLLRQIANHPVLVDEKFRHDSGKFMEIAHHMDNIYEEKHKVLIFSSFVKHLNLVSNHLREKGYKHVMLTGETRDRQKIIKTFQEEEDVRFFLISLKAGGVGLNLTAADYVFILDPWWNPASENQAINRAHRIGQVQKVFVYRFISHETIEEKIQMLQQKKRALADAFVNSNNPFKSMDKGAILELFD